MKSVTWLILGQPKNKLRTKIMLFYEGRKIGKIFYIFFEAFISKFNMKTLMQKKIKKIIC